MSTSVLLARPHTFIVSEMKPFLEEAGFKVIKADKPSDLTDLSRGCAGAVISLAVSSSMDISPEDVIKRLREANAKMPLLFAALLPYAKVKDSLERVGRQAGLDPKVWGLEGGDAKRFEMGSKSGLLYLSKDDLANPVTRQQALQAVRRHFGTRG